MDANEVKKSLAARAEEFAAWIFPQGKRQGNEWQVADISGAPGTTLRVAIHGAKTGVFCDFNGGDVKGDNLLELLIQARSMEFRDALAAAREWLGIRSDGVTQHAKREYKKPSRKGITRIVEPVLFNLLGRGLSEETVTAFKIASDSRHNMVIPFLSQTAELEMIKFVALERDEKGKKKSWTNDGAKKVLMGKHLLTKQDRSLVITEGEIDAMSYREAGIKACSVPFGAKWTNQDGSDPNDEWIQNDWEFLQDFERIYLSLDMDDTGRKATASVLERLGIERCWLVTLPEKDANEVLMKHGADALKKAVAEAKQQELENLRNAAHYAQQVQDVLFPASHDETPEGVPMPWKLSGGDFHWRTHEVTIITGFNGSGKTVLLNWLLLHFAQYEKRAFVASLEVPPVQNLRVLVSQCVGDQKPESPEHLNAVMGFLAKGFWYYDHQGQLNRKDLLKAMEYSFRRYGTTIFVIDSLMKCGLSADDYNGQKATLDDLTDFSARWPVHIFLVAHSRKQDDESKRAGKMDVKGAGEITDMAHNVWTVFRNKKKERTIRSLTEKGGTALMEATRVAQSEPDCWFTCEKQRNGLGQEPECRLWFNIEAKQFHDAPRQPQVIVVEPADTQETPASAEEPQDPNEPF